MAMRTGPKVFAGDASWDDFQHTYGDGLTIYTYLQKLFPTSPTSVIKVLEQAFDVVEKQAFIRINWNDPTLECVPDIVARCTLHCTNPSRAISIRLNGLLPSPHGARSDTPMLYTSRLRNQCSRSWCSSMVFPNGTTFAKHFSVERLVCLI